MTKTLNKKRTIGRLGTLSVVAVLSGLTGLPGLAATVYVDILNDSGTEDGTAAFPYNTIQEGLDNGISGDTVLVLPGLYKETILMRNGITLMGSGPDQTIIDATGIPNSVVTFDGTRTSPKITGFTITGGKGDVRDFIGNDPVTVGGGVLIIQSDAVVMGNVITGNVLDEGYCLGGGIYVDAVNSGPKIVDNVISDNIALSATIAGSGSGGAIYIVAKNGVGVIEGNYIVDNVAVEGGAVLADIMNMTVVDVKRNDVERNTARTGAGIHLSSADDSLGRVTNNVFRENGSTDPAAQGGGAYVVTIGTGTFHLVNNTFVDQSIPLGSGGALYLDDSAGTTLDGLVVNNVFAFNTATTGGGIDYTAFAGTILRNDFHANPGGDLYDAGGSAATLTDNLFVDPEFLLPVTGNFQLGPTSPLIDTADEANAPVNDRTAFLRPYDGNADLIDQSDLGAYEYPAGELLGLFYSAADSLEWPVPPELTSFDFNVYRASLSRMLATGEYTQDPLTEPLAAQTCGVLPAALPFADDYTPPVGEAVYYLVTPTQPGYEGGIGRQPDGNYRKNLNACP